MNQRSFRAEDTMQSVFNYVESLELVDGNGAEIYPYSEYYRVLTLHPRTEHTDPTRPLLAVAPQKSVVFIVEEVLKESSEEEEEDE